MEMFKFNLVEGYTIEGKYPKFGKGTFKVLMQDGEYYGEMVVEMGGNIQGSELLASILETINDMGLEPNMDFEENKKHVVVNEEGLLKGVNLYDAEGNSLFIDAEYDPKDLIHVIVGVVMVKYELKKE